MDQKFSRYEIDTEIGRGAYGVVYRARDTRLNRPVAIKIIHPLLTNDLQFLEQFEREAEIAANLQHPNIVPVYDYGEENGRYFLVMQLMDGGSVAELVQDGPLSWERTLQIATDVATGLDFMHEQGLVHRDVKPANILLNTSGQAFLSDFGIVQALNNTSVSQSLTDGVLGTPAYVAPEIWEGKTAVPATDQYALACVVYEMIAGEKLFDGKTPLAIIAQHQIGNEITNSLPSNTIVNNIRPVLKKALSEKPANRFDNIKSFIEKLSTTQSVNHLLKKYVQFFAISAIVILLILLAVALLTNLKSPLVNNHPPTILELTAHRQIVAPGDTVSVSVIAIDDDDDPLFFRWQADFGTVPNAGTGNTIQYTAPMDVLGLDQIKVMVSDGNGGTSTEKVTISVQSVERN